MSGYFHKSCYTSRSAGYKYRTLSTNTGDRKRRNGAKEDTTFERRFKDLKNEICTRVLDQVMNSQEARKSIQQKFERIEAKIDSMVEVQRTIVELRRDLCVAENQLVDVVEKVGAIEKYMGVSETGSMESQKSSFYKPRPIFDIKSAYKTVAN